ncbi:hypothetical protein O185_23825 [Photorhabdus temperata J3]|uniref:Uncharacterized protein n=1 Tax=Photorhabdus temperata J3 TaxID=1389415 RepID=U7QRL1_PHOTE|nr:hypothetical protein O185_23825 [Photorhabdus temperata J3]
MSKQNKEIDNYHVSYLVIFICYWFYIIKINLIINSVFNFSNVFN